MVNTCNIRIIFYNYKKLFNRIKFITKFLLTRSAIHNNKLKSKLRCLPILLKGWEQRGITSYFITMLKDSTNKSCLFYLKDTNYVGACLDLC